MNKLMGSVIATVIGVIGFFVYETTKNLYLAAVVVLPLWIILVLCDQVIEKLEEIRETITKLIKE